MSRLVRSAGLLPSRIGSVLEVLIAHPGGPFFEGRDEGAWTLLKGLVEKGEDDLTTAAREFEEETGWPAPGQPWIPLGETVMRSRKVVIAWAVEKDYEPNDLMPGTFTLRGREYPEIDFVEWAEPQRARAALNPALGVFVDRLELHLGLNGSP